MLCTLLALLVCPSQAFYALEEIKIDPQELESPTLCSIVSAHDLVAYDCANSFKVFHVESLETPTLVYSTLKAVAQVKPSKLRDDPFISFVEARAQTDLEPAAYAYVKVVDKLGVRDLGISTTFLPNRSIYIGNNLLLKVTQAQSNLQMYDLVTKRTSSFITI